MGSRGVKSECNFFYIRVRNLLFFVFENILDFCAFYGAHIFVRFWMAQNYFKITYIELRQTSSGVKTHIFEIFQTAQKKSAENVYQVLGKTRHTEI